MKIVTGRIQNIFEILVCNVNSGENYSLPQILMRIYPIQAKYKDALEDGTDLNKMIVKLYGLNKLTCEVFILLIHTDSSIERFYLD